LAVAGGTILVYRGSPYLPHLCILGGASLAVMEVLVLVRLGGALYDRFDVVAERPVGS
jgi:hypothetical protein